jgi:sporulation protein YlmC with PRC-barrel domain
MDHKDTQRDTFGRYAEGRTGSLAASAALIRAHKLLGQDVRNKDGEDLGELKDLMVDMASGRVAYAVLSFGGVMGLGDKLFAVPWAALSLDADGERFMLNVPKQTLKDAPGFDKDHWPSMSDKAWATGVHRFYGMAYTAE